MESLIRSASVQMIIMYKYKASNQGEILKLPTKYITC